MKAIARESAAGRENPHRGVARLLLFSGSVILCIGAFAAMPGADPSEFKAGLPEVAASSNPNVLWLSVRETAPFASIKALAVLGTPGAPGPSANVGQTISLKGLALNPGVASFTGYNGTDVTSPLTSIKPMKKGKAVVPPLAITGDVTIIPDGGEETAPRRLQIVPTISSLSTTTISPGTELTINGTGFDPVTRVVFPGVADVVTPTTLDNDSAVVTVPAGAQKGKLKVTTPGGTSNTVKIKLATASFANHALATNPLTGEILATDDNENILVAMDPATGIVTRTLPVVDEPSRLLLMHGGELRVINDSGEVTFVNLATWEARSTPVSGLSSYSAPSCELDVDRGVLRSTSSLLYGTFEITIGPGAEAYAESSNGRAVVVAGDRGILYVVDLATRSVVDVHRFDGPIEGVTVGLDGRAYTIDRQTGALLAVPID